MKEDDRWHLLTITSIKCIKPSAAVGSDTKLALTGLAVAGAAAFGAAGCVATAGGGCAFAAPMIGKLTGTLGALATVAQKASDAAANVKLAEAALNAKYSGTEDLIVRVNGQQVFPTSEMCKHKYSRSCVFYQPEGYSCKGYPKSCEIEAGETLKVPISVSFMDAATIQLVDYDVGSDNDDLGFLKIDAGRNPHKGDELIIYGAAEDTIYLLSYTIDEGKGNEQDIPKYLQCGTVECRPCEGASCRDHSSLDRDGDTEDLKACPGSYVHDRFEKFPQWWPFSDVYLRICKLKDS